MNTTRGALKEQTVFQLAGDWKSDLVNLFKKEVELAKTEVTEKVSGLGKNIGFMAAGGVLGLMALLILLFSLGAIIAFGLRAAGLSPGMAYFSAYIGLALVCAGVGYALINKGMNAMKAVSMAPEKTLETLKELKGEENTQYVARIIQKKEKKSVENKQSSGEIKNEIDGTRERIEDEMEEIKNRLRPKHLAKTAWAMARERPARILIIAAATGLGGAWLMRHRSHTRV